MRWRAALAFGIVGVITIVLALWGIGSCAVHFLTPTSPTGQPRSWVAPSIFREDCDPAGATGLHWACQRTEPDGRVIPVLQCYFAKSSPPAPERYVSMPPGLVDAYCIQHDRLAHATWLWREENPHSREGGRSFDE